MTRNGDKMQRVHMSITSFKQIEESESSDQCSVGALCSWKSNASAPVGERNESITVCITAYLHRTQKQTALFQFVLPCRGLWMSQPAASWSGIRSAPGQNSDNWPVPCASDYDWCQAGAESVPKLALNPFFPSATGLLVSTTSFCPHTYPLRPLSFRPH